MSGAIGARVCVDCAAGQVSTSAGATCTACGAGKYANFDKTACVLCPKGKFSSTIGANDHLTCQNCSAGRYSSAEGVADVSGCNACSPGKFSKDHGNIEADKCRDCPMNYFQRQEAQTTCTVCPAGATTDKNGSSECTRCDLGRFAADGTCRACDPGRFADARQHPSAPSARLTKSPTTKARRAPYLTGKPRLCAGATARGTWTTRTTTSTPGCAWHVQRVRTAALARLAFRREFLRNGIIAASAGTRRCSERALRLKPVFRRRMGTPLIKMRAVLPVTTQRRPSCARSVFPAGRRSLESPCAPSAPTTAKPRW